MITNTEKITQACIKANPEIMELKFGCEVEYEHRIRTYDDGETKGKIKLRAIVSGKTKDKNRICITTKMGKGSHQRYWLEGMKIIGRPIRLADIVLMILENVEGYARNNKILKVALFMWNLEDDNLDHQSKETINFIYGLIK